MTRIKKRVLTSLLLLCLVSGSSLALAGCDVAEEVSQAAADAVSQLLEGEVEGKVGKEYATIWFTFSVTSLEVTQSYDDYAAAEGNTLVVAHIIETNTSDSSVTFGTFDWFVDDGSLVNPVYPLDAFTDEMMPSSFSLASDETAEYDVVIECAADLTGSYLMYIEVDEYDTMYTTFKIPLS